VANSLVLLNGYVDIWLVDKKTGRVDKHVRQRNQITEAFARWLLLANPTPKDSVAVKRMKVYEEEEVYQGEQIVLDHVNANPISLFLRSNPYLKATSPLVDKDTNVVYDTNLMQGYQIVRHTSGTGQFSMFLMSRLVFVNPQSYIPPTFDISLNSITTERDEEESVVVFYGNSYTKEADDPRFLVPDHRHASHWDKVRSNPKFTTCYYKDNGAGTFSSVVMGAMPGNRDKTAIAIAQSPAELPESWDTAWHNWWKDPSQSGVPAIVANKRSDYFLIAPFLRASATIKPEKSTFVDPPGMLYREGRFGDGLYAVGPYGFINFYDLLSLQFDDNRAGMPSFTNIITGERYTTTPESFVAPLVSGGFAIGNGKAFRVNKGRAIFEHLDELEDQLDQVNADIVSTSGRIVNLRQELENGVAQIIQDLETTIIGILGSIYTDIVQEIHDDLNNGLITEIEADFLLQLALNKAIDMARIEAYYTVYAYVMQAIAVVYGSEDESGLIDNFVASTLNSIAILENDLLNLQNERDRLEQRIKDGKETGVFRCIGRTFVIDYQDSLSGGGSGMKQQFETDIVYATGGNSIPLSIWQENAPVMVAVRGNSEREDKIEIFMSLGVGEFEEYEDEHGVHPGGVGVELHKFTLNAFYVRWTTAGFGPNIRNNPSIFQYHGRVAVLPFAVGRTTSQKDAEIDTTTLGGDYVVGGYDPHGEAGYGLYYLPVTHFLRGVSTFTWFYDDEVESARDVVLCSSDTYQHGVVLDSEFEFIRNFPFGVDGVKIALLSTADGLVPITVNQMQRWQPQWSWMMSALNLEEPVTKNEDQRLYVSYSYEMEVYDEPPSAVDFEVTVNSATSCSFTWPPVPFPNSVVLTRALSDLFARGNTVSLNARRASFDSEHDVMRFSDGTVLPKTKYYYRMKVWNGVDFSLPTVREIITSALVDKPVAPTNLVWYNDIVSWQWPQMNVAPFVKDDITRFFLKWELQFKFASEPDSEFRTIGFYNMERHTTRQAPLPGYVSNLDYVVRLRAVINPKYYDMAGLNESEWAVLDIIHAS